MGDAGTGFAYDNERPRHWVDLPDFEIDRTPVTNGAYLEFVGDGGYARKSLWCAEGWRWRTEEAVERPLYWDAEGNERRFERTDPDRSRDAGDARVLVRGGRVRALAGSAAAQRGRVGEGGGVRSRGGRGPPASPGATRTRRPGEPTSTSSPSAPRRRDRCRTAPRRAARWA